jgi:hypothetical protein
MVGVELSDRQRPGRCYSPLCQKPFAFHAEAQRVVEPDAALIEAISYVSHPRCLALISYLQKFRPP